DDGAALLMEADSQTGEWKQIARIFHEDSSVNAVAFSPDGRYLATANSDGTACVIATATGMEIARLSHGPGSSEDDGTRVVVVAFSPDDKYVATASGDFTARIMNAATSKEVARLKHQGIVNAVAFYPDGRFIATASDDLTARVMEVATRREVSRIGHQDAVHD